MQWRLKCPKKYSWPLRMANVRRIHSKNAINSTHTVLIQPEQCWKHWKFIHIFLGISMKCGVTNGMRSDRSTTFRMLPLFALNILLFWIILLLLLRIYFHFFFINPKRLKLCFNSNKSLKKSNVSKIRLKPSVFSRSWCTWVMSQYWLLSTVSAFTSCPSAGTHTTIKFRCRRLIPFSHAFSLYSAM